MNKRDPHSNGRQHGAVLLALGLALVLWASSCFADSDEKTMMLPETDTENQATGAAFAADSMHFRRPMPSHPNWKPLEFYFKHCTEIGQRAYYSKTSYDCTGPY